jgi:hypothetical protein
MAVENKIYNEYDQTQRAKKRTGCTRTVIILPIMTILIGLLIVKVIVPFFETGGGNVDTRVVPGDAARFDPVGALSGVQAFAGADAELTDFEASYVRSDGTMDLTASYRPRVEYKFVHKVPPPPDAPPVGAGGTLNGGWYEQVNISVYTPGQWRHVTSGSSEYSYMNRGMQRDTDSPTTTKPDVLPTPTCSFADLWKVALEYKAPADAVATIEYDHEGYHFDIRDTTVDLDFGMDCRLKKIPQ